MPSLPSSQCQDQNHTIPCFLETLACQLFSQPTGHTCARGTVPTLAPQGLLQASPSDVTHCVLVCNWKKNPFTVPNSPSPSKGCKDSLSKLSSSRCPFKGYYPKLKSHRKICRVHPSPSFPSLVHVMLCSLPAPGPALPLTSHAEGSGPASETNSEVTCTVIEMTSPMAHNLEATYFVSEQHC